jgi:bud site selection protein 20
LRRSTAWWGIGRGAHTRDGEGILIFGRETGLIVNRVKALKEEPYTQKEAEAAVGLRTDNGPRMAAKENMKDMEVEMENSGLLDEGLVT